MSEVANVMRRAVSEAEMVSAASSLSFLKVSIDDREVSEAAS